ncbi:AMP-binding protein [Ichthyenterobacterium magnum]|uniref:O-succinylbenzoic acid--CoA ligase n=1 Tax=Ichthyenterobacterium magnum TaxID=1230530 RepID=A0A420DLW2_9FLAO|nr:AMP-binding protein [Ichthyenterobacterium magnum]RKE95185.1 O-succinylbenzoic acid--CoA ligase [Ichthyenterobacterium magnum]
MTPTFDKIHLKFKFNSNKYTFKDLKEVAYSFVKEGDEFEKNIGDFFLDWLDDKPYIETKTSGSTGVQKVIRLSKQAMVNSAIATGDYFNLKPGDSALHCLPCNYIAGKMMMVRALILGLEVDVIKPSSAPIFSTKKRYDFSAMVPLQLKNSLKNLQHINTVIVGGASVSHKLIEDLKSLKTTVYETYGMTETVSHIAVRQLNSLKPSQTNYFKTLPDIEISQDARNCLVVNAPKLSDEVVVTNDIVELKSETQFKWLGRFDNVINSGGIKLFPEQIEVKLQNRIRRRFFITSEKDEVLGEKVVLVLEDESNVLDKSYFKDLDKFEIPKKVYSVSKFSETSTGKVQRQKTFLEAKA